jgi:hypothetical protein
VTSSRRSISLGLLARGSAAEVMDGVRPAKHLVGREWRERRVFGEPRRLLRGTSLFTNRATEQEESKSDTRADGRALNATADLKTGHITWSLSPQGGFFEGEGTVVLIRGGFGFDFDFVEDD